jgi:hypothetical protein
MALTEKLFPFPSVENTIPRSMYLSESDAGFIFISFHNIH